MIGQLAGNGINGNIGEAGIIENMPSRRRPAQWLRLLLCPVVSRVNAKLRPQCQNDGRSNEQQIHGIEQKHLLSTFHIAFGQISVSLASPHGAAPKTLFVWRATFITSTTKFTAIRIA